jgi:phosphatidyl-myo-inositol dimannoside synthase
VANPDWKVNLIGGNAYSATGGIQAMNRLIVRTLQAGNFLRCGFFLWDDLREATEEGRRLAAAGAVRLYGLKRARFIAEMFWQALRHRGDGWLCTHVNYAPLGLALCLGRGRRLGVMLHAAELDGPLSWAQRFALRRARRVIAVSDFTRRKAIGLGVRPERIHVVPTAIEDPTPGFRPAVRQDEWPSVLFVGRMDEHYKGQRELIAAAALLRARVPELKTIFVGGGGSIETWQTEAARQGVADVVEFRGRVSDEELRDCYARATVFAMTSENEGFGLVYAEAMAHGVPCIGSDCDAAPEVIAHGRTGLCVPPKNAAALADAIEAVVRSPERRAEMSQAARKDFVGRFTAESYAERLGDVVGQWRMAG